MKRELLFSLRIPGADEINEESVEMENVAERLDYKLNFKNKNKKVRYDMCIAVIVSL